MECGLAPDRYDRDGNQKLFTELFPGVAAEGIGNLADKVALRRLIQALVLQGPQDTKQHRTVRREADSSTGPARYADNAGILEEGFGPVFDKRWFHNEGQARIDRFEVPPGAGDENLNVGVVHFL